MFIDFMMEGFRKNGDKVAIAWRDKTYSYDWLAKRIDHWLNVMESKNIRQGAVAVLEADYSPDSIALFLAIIEHGCVLVPITSSVGAQKPEFIEIAQGEVSFEIDEDDDVRIKDLPNSADHELYGELGQLRHPGIVFFSSGSTGKSKAAVHDMMRILEKFKAPRHSYSTIPFLLFDHIGGVNTLLYTLSNSGYIVTAHDRSPDAVLALVEKYRIELLPTSPTFINLILLSEAYKRHDISSLKIVSYGTEPMPQSTLKRFHELFPEIRLLQTYGLSELGILRSKSKSSDSLWVKVGGEGFQTRVVDGILQIKAHSAMVGYLNAQSPFTEDGWFNTGDSVEVNGEYMRILGRKSEMINVGGEKVHPTEIEDVIQEMDNVAEVTVYGEKNPIMGNIVCAKVRLLSDEDHKKFTACLKRHCRERMAKYKVPVKIKISDEAQHSERFKKQRS